MTEQDGVPWAATHKKSKEPMGDKCLRCLRVSKLGFPTMEWSEILSEMKSNPDFHDEVQCAIDVFEGKPKQFRQETFDDASEVGYRMERSAWFYSEMEIEKKYGLKMKELLGQGFTARTVLDETGEEVYGLMVSDDLPRKIVFYQSINTLYAEQVHNKDTALRPQQGRALASSYRAEVKKHRPLPKDIIPSEETLEEAVEAVKVAKAAAQARAQMASVVSDEVPAQPAGVLQGGQNAEAEAEEDEVVWAESEERQPLVQNPKGKGKGKGKPKSKAKPKGKAKAKALAAHCRSVIGGDDGASTADGSADSSSRTQICGDDRASEAYDKYVDLLSISKLLKGESLGRELWAAQRSLSALSKGAADSVQHVLLKGHVDLFQRSKGLLPEKVMKISEKERKDLVAELVSHNVEFPKVLRANLLACAVRESKDPAEIIQIMSCSGAHAKFNPLQPVLKDAELTDTETSKLLHKCLVGECLVPAIVEGDAVQLLARCKALSEHFKESTGLAAIVKVAVGEIQDICLAIASVLSTEVDVSAGSKAVERLMTASQGSPLIVRQASIERIGPPHQEEL